MENIMSTVIYQPYVYIIKFKPTQQIYIGVQFRETNDIANPCQLWTTYFGSGPNVIKLREMFDEDDFQCRVLSVWNTKEEVLAEEKRILKKYDAKNNLRFLNESNGGGGGVQFHTEDTRKVMSEKAVLREAKKKEDGYEVSEKTREIKRQQMMGNTYSKGKKWSAEKRAEHSKRLKGRTFTPEHRANLSKANKAYAATCPGGVNPNLLLGRSGETLSKKLDS